VDPLPLLYVLIAGLFVLFSVFLKKWVEGQKRRELWKKLWIGGSVVLIFTVAVAFAIVLSPASLPPAGDEPFLKITQPLAGSNVTINELVEGVSTNVPVDNVIWVFVSVPNINRYYPMDNPAILQYNGEWSSQTTLGRDIDSGGQFDILVVLADIDAQNEINTYLSQNVNPPNGIYHGMPKLPSGATVFDMVRVTRSP
jgi:hypothetical protein